MDFTWSTADICVSVRDWRVLSGYETLSDHEYIIMEFGGHSSHDHMGNRRPRYPRWNWSKFDVDKFQAALTWSCSVTGPETDQAYNTAELKEQWVSTAIRLACDASAPRSGKRRRKTQAYWWSGEISQLRRSAVRARRAWTHAKERRKPRNIIDSLLELYRTARKELTGGRTAINMAKITAWQELIRTIDADPWGMPYKIVLSRLRQSSVSLTETLEEDITEILLSSLFPDGVTHDPSQIWNDWQWNHDESYLVTSKEVIEIIKKKAGNNTAPGTDGIKMSTLSRIPPEMLPRIAGCLSECLREGVFPAKWKKAMLVLIPKGGPSDNRIPKVRPICLLNEMGKIFEKIIVDRLHNWMDTNPLYQLSHNQYGFRQGRSTCDALLGVQQIITEAIDQDGVVVAVGIDIKNAFNSLPWSTIRDALARKRVPEYLRRVIDHNLFQRSVEYIDKKGRLISRPMLAGVPQGSVLGPTLWNIGYDSVLQEGYEFGCQIICYADDTLVLATADTIQLAAARVNLQTAMVVNRIQRLRLTVAADKTETIVFYGRNKPKRMPLVVVGGEIIPTTPTIKYLGVILDNKMSFHSHLEYVVETKVAKVTRALGRLMPNLRGPKEAKRKLYANIILSIILYAAPIWCDALAVYRKSRIRLDRMARMINLRVAAAYGTVSLEGVSLLVRIPPLHLLAALRKRTYLRLIDLQNSTDWSNDMAQEIGESENLIMRRQWAIYLEKPNLSGARIRGAILPILNDWLDRKHGSLVFHVTQIISGHGCFGNYLYRIDKVDSPKCEHCDSSVEDSADHTLQQCRGWAEEREALASAIGNDLSLGSVMRAICSTEEA